MCAALCIVLYLCLSSASAALALACCARLSSQHQQLLPLHVALGWELTMFLSSPPRLHQMSTFIAWSCVLRALCCLQGSRSHWWLMGMIGRPASFPTDRARLAWLSGGLRGCLSVLRKAGWGPAQQQQAASRIAAVHGTRVCCSCSSQWQQLMALGVRSWRCGCDCYVALTQWAAEEAVRGWVRQGLVWRGLTG
jgi:hypothetical protein